MENVMILDVVKKSITLREKFTRNSGLDLFNFNSQFYTLCVKFKKIFIE